MIDYGALLGTAAKIGLSVVEWDWAKDFANPGFVPLRGDPLPAGAIVLVAAVQIITPIVQVASPTNSLSTGEGCGMDITAATISHVELQSAAYFNEPLEDERPWYLEIVTNGITAGSFKASFLYILP